MCRACHDANGNRIAGRRCPSDTNEARRLRWQAAKTAKMFTAEVKPVDKTQPAPATPNPAENPKQVVADHAQQLRELLNKEVRGSGRDTWNEAVSNVTVAMGAAVEKLAEEKYGAPTDEQLAEAWEETARLNAEAEQEFRDACQPSWDAYATAQEKWVVAMRATRRLCEEHQGEENFTETPEYLAVAQAEKEAAEEHQKASRAARDAEFAAQKIRDAKVSNIPVYGAKTKEEKEAYENNRLRSKYSQLIEKRRDAIKQALQEVGVEFANKEDINISEDSQKPPAEAVREASTMFPKTWVEASNIRGEQQLDVSHGMLGDWNTNAPLTVKTTTGRAFYRALGTKKTSQPAGSFSAYIRPDGWNPPESEKEEWHKLPAGAKEYVDRATGKTEPLPNAYGAGADGTENHNVWVHQRHTHMNEASYQRLLKTNPKLAKEAKLITLEDYQWQNGTVPAGTYQVYTVPVVGKKETYSVESRLMVSPSYGNPTHKNPRFRIALHELSHRMDHVTLPSRNDPDGNVINTIPTATINHAFLHYRSKGESLQQIPSSPKGEVGYRDHFTNYYMGRVYKGNNTGGNEIMSMGMETLFSGTQGGFVGADGSRPDKQYKQFIIGLLATSVTGLKERN